jgi:hypothetical protein
VTDNNPGYLLASCVRTRTTFIAELARRGCRKINYSAMPAQVRVGDVRVDGRRVPLDIRRAARASLTTPQTQRSNQP